MGTAPNCNFIGAALCPGSTGPSPLWVNKALLSGSLLGSGGSFVHNGACYSIPANAQPQPPAGGSYASAGYMGETSPGCADCCAVKPEAVYFDCSGTGTATIDVSGPPGSTVYLSWNSCYLVVNGVGPSASGGSSTVTLGSGGGTFSVGTSSAVCPITCPGGPAGINVGTSPGGNECGSVAVYTGCPPCPATPASLTARVTIPTATTSGSYYGCSTANTTEMDVSVPLTQSGSQQCSWYGSIPPQPGQMPLSVNVSCVAGDGSSGTSVGQLYWLVSLVTAGPSWTCVCKCPPGSAGQAVTTIGNFDAYFKYKGPVPDCNGAVPPTAPAAFGFPNCDVELCPFTGGDASIDITQ